MRKAISNKDLETLRRLGHGTKGAALGYGMQNMAELGREIQFLAEDNKLEELAGMVDKLDDYIANVQIEFVEMEDDED